jgi:prepilin peptidase CpaA
MSTPSFVVAVPLLAILAVATFSDLRTRRIPNALSLGGAAFGLLVNVVNFGTPGAVAAVLGWSLCLACFFPLYFSGGTAAGDVKLMATVGAFLGPMNGLLACAVALAAGAALGSLCMAWRSYATRLVAPAAQIKTLDKIPYAGAIAVGAVAAVAQPAWVTALVQ